MSNTIPPFRPTLPSSLPHKEVGSGSLPQQPIGEHISPVLVKPETPNLGLKISLKQGGPAPWDEIKGARVEAHTDLLPQLHNAAAKTERVLREVLGLKTDTVPVEMPVLTASEEVNRKPAFSAEVGHAAPFQPVRDMEINVNPKAFELATMSVERAGAFFNDLLEQWLNNK
jgi:hypothetical protein